MNPPYVETPLIPSVYLSKLANCDVYLKLENCQPSGSFKSRGLATVVSRRLRSAADPEKVEFFSSSGGNAGLATAHAARFYNRPCTVVVPKTTKPAMLERLAQADAQTIVHGDHWAEADDYLRNELIPALPQDVVAVYCHPFDGQDLWEGHSTMVDELKSQLPRKPDAVVLAVGGGGLYNGVVLGLQRNDWKDVPVIAVETEGAACFARSIEKGERVFLDKISTVASSLGATHVTPEALVFAKLQPTNPVTVTDEQAVNACVHFAQDHKFIVEPACGAALSVAYENNLTAALPNLNADSVVVVIVCGGTSTSLDDLMTYRQFKSA
jgi:L-serine/L-threonine ammonia-lyase